MREIKFRGKMVYEMPKQFSEWIHGYLCFVYTDNPFKARIYNTSTAKSYDVLTETVGQFTGLLDKNGVEIWEGDVVVRAYEQWRKYTVEYWGTGWGSFVLVKDGKYFESDLADYSVLEVIGNIHEQEG